MKKVGGERHCISRFQKETINSKEKKARGEFDFSRSGR